VTHSPRPPAGPTVARLGQAEERLPHRQPNHRLTVQTDAKSTWPQDESGESCKRFGSSRPHTPNRHPEMPSRDSLMGLAGLLRSRVNATYM
jgi:hypothetical protein